MIRFPRSSSCQRNVAALGACCFLTVVAALPAQTTPAQATTTTTAQTAEPVFVELGRSKVEFSDGNRLSTAYTLSATQPPTSKLTGQKVRFLTETTTTKARQILRFDINTGQHKTVKQLAAALSGIFSAAGSGQATAGQELGKIGDLSHGGEIHFVAESPGGMRLDILTQDAPASQRKLDRDDAQAFADLLKAAAK